MSDYDFKMFGFLFWLSTPVLRRMEAEGRLDLEQVYDYCRNNIDWETPEGDMVKMCRSRLRIYKAFKRVEKDCFLPKSYNK